MNKKLEEIHKLLPDNTTGQITESNVRECFTKTFAYADEVKGISDAPSDNKQYARKNGAWEDISAKATPTIADVLRAGNQLSGHQFVGELKLQETKLTYTGNFSAGGRAMLYSSTNSADGSQEVMSIAPGATFFKFGGSYKDNGTYKDTILSVEKGKIKVTGGTLEGTTYITPTKDEEYVQKKYVDAKFIVSGRKPKCFPFFTNHPMRRTYPESIIRISADTISEKAEFVPLMNIYQGEKPVFEKKNEVHSHNFIRKLFAGKENEILTAGEIKYIPFPEVENPIHIFFETENLVFEWFSAHDKYRMVSEFEHYFDAENKLKYGSKRKKSLTINTGWILREEIALIDDLLGSNLCFIMIGNLRLKAVAVGKKNEMYDTSEHLYQMDLEFNVIETE